MIFGWKSVYKMKVIKKYFKLFIGISVLLMMIIVFFFYTKSNNLENDTLRHWKSSSIDQRLTAIKLLTATDNNTDKILNCVDKISSIPDSYSMSVKDAVKLCFVAINIKNSI